jgi:hypothetical protein
VTQNKKIQPGDTFVSDTKPGVIQAGKHGYRGADGIEPRNYYIQVSLNLREDAPSYTLVTVRSQPIQITIPKDPQTEKCK